MSKQSESSQRTQLHAPEAVNRLLDLPLVLASGSPRRAELLTQVGIDFAVRVSGVAEEADEPGADPAEVALTHARQKALDVAADLPGRIVLGADTVVVLDGRVLGKPDSPQVARETLATLSGRRHDVMTAVALALGAADGPELLATDHVRTRVQFRELHPDEIAAYVDSGEPMDKAGAYGIQGRGALLVRRIEGCYFNVVGLPLSRTWEMLRAVADRVAGAEREPTRGRRS